MAENCGCKFGRFLGKRGWRVDAYCSTMEVLGNTENNRLILWDTLHLIAPFSCDLDSCFDCFGTCVHWQYHIKVEKLCDELRKPWKDIIVECSRAESQRLCLFDQCFNKLWMTMTLVDSRVCR